MNWLHRWLRQAFATVGTIRVRLTLWYVALLAVILLAFSAFLALSLARNLAAELDRRLEAEAAQLGALLDIEDGQPALTEEDNDRLPGEVLIVLSDRSGTRRFVAAGHPELPLLAEALAQAAQGQRTFDTVRLGDGADWRVLTLPVSEGEHSVGVLQVGRSLQELTETRQQLLALLALAVPATLLLASAGGLFLAARALGPIDRITHAARTIGADDLARRLDVPPRQDEVGRLAQTFNQMLDRLEQAFRRQRRFTADASHELRTPLAMLISQIDVALARPRPAAEHRRVLLSLRDDAVRMSDLVTQLLTLARADAGQQVLARERLTLAGLVDGVLAAMAPLADQRGVRLACDADGAVRVDGDQTRLAQLVINLVDNGITYTPSGGVITVSIRPEGRWARLDVIDTGIGIAPEHLPHLVERFYRVDAGRSRAAGGAGLGLAICQWIVEAHGGTMTVASQPRAGTTVTVRLPLAPAAPEPGLAGRR